MVGASVTCSSCLRNLLAYRNYVLSWHKRTLGHACWLVLFLNCPVLALVLKLDNLKIKPTNMFRACALAIKTWRDIRTTEAQTTAETIESKYLIIGNNSRISL